jgi:hypothetical protein
VGTQHRIPATGRHGLLTLLFEGFNLDMAYSLRPRPQRLYDS